MSIQRIGISLLFASITALYCRAQKIQFEAESGHVAAPMVVAKDSQASGGAYVWTPEGSGNVLDPSVKDGSVTYTFTVPKAGLYTLWGKVFTPGKPGTRKDSFFVHIDDRDYVWRIRDWSDNWVWRKLTVQDPTKDISFKLDAGKHTLVIGQRVAGTKLDQIKIEPVDAGLSPQVAAAEHILANKVDRYTRLSPYFDMPDLTVPHFPERTFDIRKFGAVGDGKTMNTRAIAKAINACSEAGGGHVVIPAGKWLTGPIHLKSNIDLHVSKGAEVLFSTNFNDYLPVVFTRWEGLECYNYSPCVYANGLTNIAITGQGTLNGQGKAWWSWKNRQDVAAERLYRMAVAGVPPTERVFGTEKDGLRPNFVQFISCRNVLVQNVTLVNGPMWTLHPVYCTNVIVRGIKVKTVGPNNDGIDPDSVSNMLIEDCYFSTGDDCVCLKSGLNEDGWRVARPTQNIIVRNIYGNQGHGGIVVGSEMSGGVRNVYAHDCYFDGTDRGVRIKSMRGRGGIVQNVWVDNLHLRNIGGQAVRLNMFYASSTVPPATKTPPLFRNIHISNITCNGAAQAVEITGLPEKPIRDIFLKDFKIASNRGLSVVDGKGIHLDNVLIEPEIGAPYTLENSRDVTIDETRNASSDPIFLDVSGPKSGDIILQNVNLNGAGMKAVHFSEKADPSAVQIE